MNAYDLETLAKLIAALPPAPEAWVEAAKELPLARQSIDEIVERAQADHEFRKALVADLESAGYEPQPQHILEALRKQLP